MASHDKAIPVRIAGADHERIREAASRTGRTVTEEVRQRLALAFEKDETLIKYPRLAEFEAAVRRLVVFIGTDIDLKFDSRALFNVLYKRV